uniref:Uncharacterized protein n=1 Tax=Arundo donax TaxID=35708 RepID=A0A0A9H180_ARUDO
MILMSIQSIIGLQCLLQLQHFKWQRLWSPSYVVNRPSFRAVNQVWLSLMDVKGFGFASKDSKVR